MNFDLSKIKFIIFDFDGIFTDNTVIVNEDGKESAICNRSDGIGVSRLKKIGVDILILSTEEREICKRRAEKLNIDCINNCKDKAKKLKEEVSRRGFSLNQVAYVGNDINDIACLKLVGLPIVVADSHKDVLQYGKFKTKLGGGQGAVREICDMIYLAKKGM